MTSNKAPAHPHAIAVAVFLALLYVTRDSGFFLVLEMEKLTFLRKIIIKKWKEYQALQAL